MKKVKNLIFLVLISIIVISHFNVSNAGILSRLRNKKNSTNNITTVQKDNIVKGLNSDGSFLSNTNITTELLNKYSYETGESAIQGSCTDGEYIYISTVSKKGNKSPYINQTTKILVIDLKTKKIVKRVELGKIGHSNALTYNSNDKTIIISTCSPLKNYVYKVSTSEILHSKNLNLIKVYLKDEENKIISNKKNISSISYNLGKNEYCIVWSNNRIVIFDENFKQKRILELNSELNSNKNITGQSIYCDSSYIYYVCNNINSGLKNAINYVKIYDYNGQLIRKSAIRNTGAEFESIFAHKGTYYIVGNSIETDSGKNKYYIKIYKLNLRNDSKFEISFFDENKENINASIKNQTTKYQTIVYGNDTKILNTGFNMEGKKLVGYKIYRDYDNSWCFNVNGENKWLSIGEIQEYKRQGKKLSYAICKTTSQVKKLTKAGNSVLMIAIWE